MTGQWRRQSKGQKQIGAGSNTTQIVANVFDAVKLVGAEPATLIANTLYRGLIPKAWLHYNQTGTPAIQDEIGIASVSDDATGRFTATVDLSFTGATAMAAVGMGAAGNFLSGNNVPTASTVSMRSVSRTDAAADVDVDHNMVVFFGRQA